MAPLPPAERAALARANKAARAQVRDRLVAYARTTWGGLGSWRDRDVDQWVAAMVPRVLAAQTTVANLTDAYIARVTGTKPAGIVSVAELRGVPADVVYRRPATTMYTALSEGKTMAAALSESLSRAQDLVVTDVQLAMTHQSQASMESSGVQFYQRVLTGAQDCALCIIASTQHYRVQDLLPIHPGCNCDVDVVEPGTPRFRALDGSMRIIDSDTLEDVHAKVEGLTGAADRGARDPDYRKLIVTREHGEIGPLLGWKHQQFTGPNDL